MFELRPGELTIKNLHELLDSDIKIRLVKSAYISIEKSHSIVQEAIRQNKVIYGVNTGFGLLANRRIEKKELKDLQRKIILSHASGVGNPLNDKIVKLVILLKINSLALGYSGVSRRLIDTLLALYNASVYPVIPEQGSVGASGDLAPLAHMSMAVIGEGTVHYQGKYLPTKEALSLAKITPIELMEKEGLALLNGTQVSTAIATIGLLQAQRNFGIATIAGAMSLDAIAGSIKPFCSFISKVKNSENQLIFSRVVEELMEGSGILSGHHECPRVQDPYSIRCQPQVMGVIMTNFKNAQKELIDEANGASDNPLVCPDTGEIISGGNFHAERTAINADITAIACSEIGAISERRIALLIDKNLSGLPPFLVENPGLNSGFMLAHVTASALASENKTLAHPASIDSLPTSANQEDHVSMATFGAVKLVKLTDNVLNILAIETLAACQGIDFRSPLKTSRVLQSHFDMVREVVPFYSEDRYFAKDINLAREIISHSSYYGQVCNKIFY